MLPNYRNSTNIGLHIPQQTRLHTSLDKHTYTPPSTNTPTRLPQQTHLHTSLSKNEIGHACLPDDKWQGYLQRSQWYCQQSQVFLRDTCLYQLEACGSLSCCHSNLMESNYE